MKAMQKNNSQSSKSAFIDGLRKIAKANEASSHAAIEASKATKPSLHTRFVYNPAKDHA